MGIQKTSLTEDTYKRKDKHRDIERESPIEGKKNREWQTDGQSNRQTDGRTHRHIVGLTDGRRDK
jgi:hypothetical protein